MITLSLNGKPHELDVPDDMPLLWAVRDVLGLTGTKYGCGAGLCGTCTMHLDGEPVRACIVPVADAVGKQLTTVEGLAADSIGKVVQEAWVKVGVPQCGFCQVGQVMSATALLKSNAQPDDAAIEEAMIGNICRCGTYNRIKTAIHLAAGQIKGGAK